jgi:RNA polymerase sigma factor (sigma-70 family)
VIQDCQAKRQEFMLQPTPRVSRSCDESASDLTLRELFVAEETSLLRYAFSLTGRRAVAEEIVQEVFLLLHKQWEEVTTPKAWLIRTVRNKSFNYLRDNKREVLRGDDDGRGGGDQSPEVTYERMEAAAAVRRLMGELDETDRELLRLKYFDDLKYREISARTGLSMGNVGYRLHHILKELAEKLQQLGIDGES